MSFDLVIRGGRIATPEGVHQADIGIRGGKIAEIGDLFNAAASETLDATGLTVMPGVIDTQVHFREPGLAHKEDIESGSRAALHGGVTSYLEMPNTNPSTTTAEALTDKLSRADGRSWVNYGFFVGASTENLDQLADLESLPGTPGIKVFMGSSTGSLLVSGDDDLREALRNGRKRMPIHAEDEPRNRERKSLLSAHPSPVEHPFLRDAESARLATERILRLSAETKRPVHILHVSTADELPLIADAKRDGLKTTAEVTPQHLWFAGPECYRELGTRVQMNPPIRSAEHRAGLWRALDEGLFDVFGSDHAPHTIEEKALPYPQSPSGLPGVQTLLPVLLTFVAQGRLSMGRLVQMACRNPAKLYGIAGKGEVGVGMDADLVLVDPNSAYEFQASMVQSKCGWSPYEGVRLTGRVVDVLLSGVVAIRSGERVGGPTGRMLRFSDE